MRGPKIGIIDMGKLKNVDLERGVSVEWEFI